MIRLRVLPTLWCVGRGGDQVPVRPPDPKATACGSRRDHKWVATFREAIAAPQGYA